MSFLIVFYFSPALFLVRSWALNLTSQNVISIGKGFIHPKGFKQCLKILTEWISKHESLNNDLIQAHVLAIVPRAFVCRQYHASRNNPYVSGGKHPWSRNFKQKKALKKKRLQPHSNKSVISFFMLTPVKRSPNQTLRSAMRPWNMKTTP